MRRGCKRVIRAFLDTADKRKAQGLRLVLGKVAEQRLEPPCVPQNVLAVLVLMYSVIAAAIMNLTYIARLKQELPCAVYFEEEEWRLLYRAANKTKKTPEKPYTIGEAVQYLGQLGGPKRAPSDGPPGVKTIWAGLTALNTLLACRDWPA